MKTYSGSPFPITTQAPFHSSAHRFFRDQAKKLSFTEMFPLKSLGEGFLDWQLAGEEGQDDPTLSDCDGGGDDGDEGENTTYPTEVEYKEYVHQLTPLEALLICFGQVHHGDCSLL